MISVGLTYDLRDDYLALGFTTEEAAEFDSPQTIAALEAALSRNGYAVERIGNVQALVHCLAQGKRWDIVFNICEGVSGIAREAQVPMLLETYNIPFVFSDPAVMVLTLDKAQAKRAVAAQGIPTAPFAVIETMEDIGGVALSYPLFVKPLAEGTGKGVSRLSYVQNKAELVKTCRSIMETYKQPALVETFLSGRDLTVGIIGTAERARVLGVMETFYTDKGSVLEGQSLYNKSHWQETMSYELVQDPVAQKAGEIALQAWRVLGCRDGGRVDLRCDDAHVPHFLEVNPLAGLQPAYSDYPMLAEKAGICYDSLIGEIMKEACLRYGMDAGPGRVTAAERIKIKKRIVILYSAEEAQDCKEDADTLVQLTEITQALKRLQYDVYQVPFMGATGSIEGMIRQCQPDVVFNLVESVDHSDGLQYVVAALLDRMGLPYTGASTLSMAMLSSKVNMKRILQQLDIMTPFFYTCGQQAGETCDPPGGLWIVKSDTEHASVGLDTGSVVSGVEAAVQGIQNKEQAHGGRWFAEQYIHGREFNMALLGQADAAPQFLPPAEIVFQGYPAALAKIVDHAAKWDEMSPTYRATQRRYDFTSEDQALIHSMKKIALQIWKFFSLSGAVRVDFRVDDQNRPWVIDINFNPCLTSDAGFMAAASRAGMTFDDVIKRILAQEVF